jgi:hypothetical protein
VTQPEWPIAFILKVLQHFDKILGKFQQPLDHLQLFAYNFQDEFVIGLLQLLKRRLIRDIKRLIDDSQLSDIRDATFLHILKESFQLDRFILESYPSLPRRHLLSWLFIDDDQLFNYWKDLEKEALKIQTNIALKKPNAWDIKVKSSYADRMLNSVCADQIIDILFVAHGILSSIIYESLERFFLVSDKKKQWEIISDSDHVVFEAFFVACDHKITEIFQWRTYFTAVHFSVACVLLNSLNFVKLVLRDWEEQIVL